MQNNEPATPVDSSLGYTFQNDFLALTQAFSLPEIDYTDISQREQVTRCWKPPTACATVEKSRRRKRCFASSLRPPVST
ncbi:BcsR/BcsP family cellulose biosynthesis protein [Enterobacter hormaechei]|uniref:BcsR/BcsP family cellulose biosynthesis protein n=1 Tax=Enterobacter hormaechei TaxID=158836 RepID=UPI0031DFEF18